MAIVRNIIYGGNGGNEIVVVDNYSALPNPTTVSGQFYWCSSSQGTSWLPGSLGGTYYNSGLYYSNGTTWEFLNVPYNATQSEVNSGTNNDKFVTPNTLSNSNWAFTSAKVIATLLTGFASSAGVVTSADSILQAFQKIVGNIDLKADKSLSAYSMRVNNTAAPANATEVTAKIVNNQTFSTGVTFTGTTAPSGTANLSYSWQQIGNQVTLQVQGVYQNQGGAVTAVVIHFFSDLPAPLKPAGFTAASDVLYMGTGLLAASTTTTTGVATNACIRSNSANNGFEIVISQAANSTKAFRISITYPTA